MCVHTADAISVSVLAYNTAWQSYDQLHLRLPMISVYACSPCSSAQSRWLISKLLMVVHHPEEPLEKLYPLVLSSSSCYFFFMLYEPTQINVALCDIINPM